jgi:hypothetical protein
MHVSQLACGAAEALAERVRERPAIQIRWDEGVVGLDYPPDDFFPRSTSREEALIALWSESKL